MPLLDPIHLFLYLFFPSFFHFFPCFLTPSLPSFLLFPSSTIFSFHTFNTMIGINRVLSRVTTNNRESVRNSKETLCVEFFVGFMLLYNLGVLCCGYYDVFYARVPTEGTQNSAKPTHRTNLQNSREHPFKKRMLEITLPDTSRNQGKILKQDVHKVNLISN